MVPTRNLSTFVLCWLSAWLSGSCAPLAAETPLEPRTTDALEERGAVIHQIRVRVDDIFDLDDPKEDGHLFRLANRLHRTTREDVVASQLLVRPGDRYSRRAIEESERLLRANRYLSDAHIEPRENPDGTVDLEVVARDVWTLNAGLAIGRKGGVNSTRVQVQDTNLLGWGKNLTLQRSNDVDRTSTLLRAEDPALFGSRFQMGVGYADNSDGSQRQFEISRPFYSLDTHWSAGLAARDDDRIDSIYRLGHVASGFRHRQETYELQGGWSAGVRDGWARRWSAGFRYQRDRFGLDPTVAAPSSLAADRLLAYPWIGFEGVEDSYVTARNLDQMARTEDLHLGGSWNARLGLSSPAWGGDRQRWIFETAGRTGMNLGERNLLFLDAAVDGRWSGSETENTTLAAGARLYLRDFGDQLLAITVEGAVAHDLDSERQLTLGGDNGLRGYPLRYQDGDARFLLTVEQRFFTSWYPFHLAHVGAAVFFDVGRTWRSGAAVAAAGPAGDYGTLRDVGIGLRLANSRSGLGQMIHVDLAFPLDRDASIHSPQLVVSTKRTF
jgi:outer membrane protein assembly factor BamA